ncbi:uncharacterized protein V6R79_012838 [Siganus canaliculatus]
MSNRDSLGFGDLLPQDVVDIFAQEKHSKRGRKKRSHSLGRALGWLKGKKRKDLAAHGQSLGLGPALDLALDGRSSGHQGGHKGGPKAGKQAHPQAVPKRDNDSKTPSTSLFQENVFIEASRPKYVEDLHTEALEGLKMMQQQENNNGLEYQDNESTVSTATVHTDGEGGGFMTDSTIADSASVVSVQSSVSARSSRSGLTRQKSTFRPLNSGKPPEKNKTRRRHRKTVAGLDRGWTVNQRLDEEQLYNGETDDSPTTDGPQWTPGTQRTDGSLQNITVKQHLSKDQLDQLDAVHAGHRDDLALLHCLGPNSSNGQRPLSLAVPWMTTASSPQQESPGPVMSMSPQAAYMSKIIPNAVLPPSIDVVEISRGRSRNSVRTVSKSSLLMSSPAPSRASSRASTRTNSSKASTITSASRQNPPNMSDSSCWSNSESSETLVSDNSTISSSSTPRQKRSQDGDGSVKEDKASVHSSNSKSSKCTSNGNLVTKGEGAKKDGQFARSLSVIKSKRAPPPPNRSYSLHSKMKRRSRDLAEVRITSGGSSVHNTSPPGEENDKSLPSKVDSPGYSADTSSLDESSGSFSPIRSQLLEIKAEQSAKGRANASREASLPENKLSKTVSPSSGYSSQEGTPAQPSKHQHSSSPRHKRGILAKLQRLFPGSASAAQQPQASETTKPRETVPSETTVDAASVSPSVKKLIDLFNIPPPPKIHAPPPPPPEVWVHSKRSIELLLGSPVSDNTYAIIKKNPKDRRQQRKPPTTDISATKHKTPTVAVESIQGQESTEMNKENHDRLAEHSVVTAETRKVNDILNGMLVKAVERREERLAAGREGGARKTSTQATEAKTKVDPLPAISLVRIPPSPSPPPLHIPPHPPAKQTTETQSIQIVGSPEMSWPPPPPPVGFGVADEVDFPLPPPPMFGEEAPPVQASRVSTEAAPQQLSAPQGILHPPLNIPPPPSYMAPAPPVQTASPATLKKSPPPLPKDVSSPPSAKLVCLPTIQEVSSSLLVQVAPPQPEEVSPSPPPPKEASLSPAPEGVSPPEQNSPEPPPKEISPPLPAVSSLCSKESVTVLAPPQSIPPPPPPLSQLPSPAQEVHLPKEDVPPKSESDLDSSGGILMPPSSIPPPPIELLQQPQVLASATEPPTEQEDSHPLPSEVSVSTALENSGSSTETQEPGNIPPPPPLPAQGLASDKPQPIPANTEDQTQEVATTLAQGLTSDKPQPIPASTKDQTQEVAATPAQEEPTPIVTPSLLQSIKLRSVNSSPEPPKVQEQPETQVIMRTEQSSSPAPPSSASGEAPQKPIRRSLILISPTSTTPPSIALSPPPMPKSQSLVITPASLPTVLSPPKKSPSAMTATPSMNLQEAIRLRTAARSNSGPVPRLSLNSPTSPLDLHKSPSSTASFIFSKSNKKVVIETKPLQETKAAKAETETVSEESPKMGARVPPPVAKKPKPKGNDLETSDGTEQTAGQEAQEPSIKDEEKTNGTASSVEEGEKPST